MFIRLHIAPIYTPGNNAPKLCLVNPTNISHCMTAERKVYRYDLRESPVDVVKQEMQTGTYVYFTAGLAEESDCIFVTETLEQIIQLLGE